MDDRSRSLLVRWLLSSGLGLSALSITALVLWTWLPGWAPEWVARHSPWVEPVVRADVAFRYGGGLLQMRMDEWKESAVPGLPREVYDRLPDSVKSLVHYCVEGALQPAI